MNATSTRSACQFVPGHSRESSNASTAPSPVPTSYPSRNHSRWPSSSSSLATTPESPLNLGKSALHDLLEDPAEREEFRNLDESEEEPLCICKYPDYFAMEMKLIEIGDALFCEHQPERQTHSAEGMPFSERSSNPLRFNPEDDFRGLPLTERRSSDPSSGHGQNTRVSLTWPSFSRHVRNRKATTVASNVSIRSAPASRSSSKQPSERKTLSGYITPSSKRNTAVSLASQKQSICHNTPISDWSLPSMAGSSTSIYELQHDPIEREELSATPLLPPSLAECRGDEPDSPRSPLQSPSIAAFSTTDSVVGSPLMSPITLSFSSPSLSAKPSFNSIRMDLSKCGLPASSDVLPCIVAEDADVWSLKLGHANFHILPEPYIPEVCDSQSCTQLLDDWRAAQVEFWRQESVISETYGPRSQTYKLAGEKWRDIESDWRSNFLTARDDARANGESIDLEPFETTQSFALPEKFPNIDDANIVGPMSQYTKSQPSPTKKKTFLKLLTDPVSILRKA